MAAAHLLCRHAELLGATVDQSSGSVLVTVQGDGVHSYSLEKRQLGNLTLGSRKGLEFQTASAQHSERAHAGDQQQPRLRIVASVVHNQNAKSYSLCLSDPSGSTRPISDAPSQVALPGPAQSCHILQQHQQQNAVVEDAAAAPRCLAAAVVLSDGRVGVTELRPDSAGPLTVTSSGQQPAPRTVLAISYRDTLLVATQPAAGSPVMLRVLRLAAPSGDGDGAGLTEVKSLAVSCPGAAAAAAHAVPTGLTMRSAFALLQWSNGHATAVHGIEGAAGALRPATFPLADAVLANGASTSASTPATAPPPANASGRKRKNAGAADGAAAVAAARTRPRVLCAAVDDRQFVVLDLESAAAQSQVCFSLHDAQFGCPLSSGSLDIDAPLLSLDAAQCSVVGAGPEATIVRLGGAVHIINVRTRPVSLLSMVARLSVSAAAAAGAAAAAAAGSGPQAKPGIGGAGVAKALTTLPPPVSLDQALLSRQAAAAVAAATTTAAAGAAARDDGDDAQDVVLEPVPAAAVKRPEDICTSLVEQLTAAAAAAATPPPQALLDSAVSYIAGRRQHGMAVPPQLPALTARGLAAAKQWAQLGNLLQHVPHAGLSGCSEVLVTVAAAHQYQLLPRLAVCLDDVEPAALVSTLQLLLAPTTKSNLAARQQHYCALRDAAAARVAEAEKTATGRPAAAARSATAGGSAAADGALALAQCAAAAVDGFSYREVLLHPLLAIPVDAPAVQVALRRLSGPAADALLGYLAKWVGKYTGGAIGEMAAYVALPQELLFPYYHQVLEWTRMTVDAHLTRLLMARAPLPALESLEGALRSAVEGSKRLLMLRGALEHVHAAAPLPAAHIAVATQYTAEVLDLRIR